MSVWVCTHTEEERESEREVCSFSWLRAAAENFPSSPPLPAPTSLPPLFPCFRSNSGDSEEHSWQAKAALNRVDRLPFLPVAAPPPRLLALGTVSCCLHVHIPFVHGAGRGEGGPVEREQSRETLSASGSSDERNASLGKRFAVAVN